MERFSAPFRWRYFNFVNSAKGDRSEIKVYRLDVPMGNGVFIKVYVSMMGEVMRVEIPEILMDAVAKTTKLDLPKSIVLRNENYYGRSRRQRNR